MSLEGLLALAGIIFAIYAIVDPVQRRSIQIFVSGWLLVTAGTVSLLLILTVEASEIPCNTLPPLLSPLFCGLAVVIPEWLVFLLRTLSFLIPVAALAVAYGVWRRGELPRNQSEALADVMKASVQEGRYGEAARLLQKNKGRIGTLSGQACRALFDPALIRALFRSGTFVHLELIADTEFLQKSDCDHFGAIDAVVRELVRTEISPLRAAVTKSFGGHEFVQYLAEEERLISATFENPDWYFRTNAHYHLLFPALEELRAGGLDVEYNSNGRHYEARQGISSRYRCVLFLSLKAHVLALRAAIAKGEDRDFYVTDLWDLFHAIRQRSVLIEDVWDSDLANSEHPTSFAYLLYEILHDIRDLFVLAIPVKSRISRDLAMTWSFCVWDLVNSKKCVSEKFRLGESSDYLAFTLRLRHAPHDIFPVRRPGPEVTGAMADLLVGEMTQRHIGARLSELFDRLDLGKKYIFDGIEGLKTELDVE